MTEDVIVWDCIWLGLEVQLILAQKIGRIIVGFVHEIGIAVGISSFEQLMELKLVYIY